MLLRMLPLSELTPAPYNPRKPLKKGSAAYKRLARSLDEFELVQPIVWNQRSGYVVGGHQRLQILRDQGVQEVACAVVDLPPARERALNIALNNSQVGSDWDSEKLAALLEELAALPDFDATLTGFDAGELATLTYAPAPVENPEPDPADDAVQVRLSIPPQRWEAVRPALDAVLADHALEMHVRLPR